jgi:Ser/Thr protein kinase RdoA (MazF antagonist)
VTIEAKIAEGREAEVYAYDADTVVKLYRPGYVGHLAEASALAALAGRDIAPRLSGTTTIDGRHGVIMQRLDGVDLLTLVQHHPWRLLGLARLHAQAHARVNRVHAPAQLPDLTHTLAARIETAVATPALRSFVLQVLDRLPAGDRLCHGDLHPGNVLLADRHLHVIDWANATRGAPDADHARTLLLLTHADPLPGTPPLIRALMTAGRRIYARAYTSAYRTQATGRPGHIREWITVHAAARLAEGIDAETPTLLNILTRAHRNATRSPNSIRDLQTPLRPG